MYDEYHGIWQPTAESNTKVLLSSRQHVLAGLRDTVSNCCMGYSTGTLQRPCLNRHPANLPTLCIMCTGPRTEHSAVIATALLVECLSSKLLGHVEAVSNALHERTSKGMLPHSSSCSMQPNCQMSTFSV